MGGGMVRRIIDAGFPTVLWARRPEVLAEYDGDANVESVPSPAEVAARADLVCICVWADDDVRDVVERPDGVLAGCKPGTVIAIHSTVAPATCRELAERAAAQDVTVLDVPVSGGRDVALAGSLTVAVGGDEGAAEHCRPVFESYGDPVIYVGPVGAAQAVKLINNALLTANMAIADDALTIGTALGVRVDAIAQWLQSGSGRSYGLDVVMRARSSREMRDAARPALEKDVHALADVSVQEAADPRLLLSAAEEMLRRMLDPPAGWQ